MLGSDTIRVLMYSHDTFGLGHLTRTVRIASALRSQHNRISVLVLTGSPVASYLPLPPGADFVKLPSAVKTGREQYRSRDLSLNFSQIKKLRAQVIRATTSVFRPHVFMVDNVPLGMKGEILPTLEALRVERPETRIVLDLRDILDDPGVIRSTWSRDGVDVVLRTLYDRIYVLGDPSVYDTAGEYDLPRGITREVGYAVPTYSCPGRRSGALRKAGRPCRILLTAGGGGDGLDLLTVVMDALAGWPLNCPEFQAGPAELEVVTGPLMDPQARRGLIEAARLAGATLHEFVADLPRRMAQADLVVAMAGYNTCCEILACADRALLAPRVAPRVEQLLRARALAARGLVSILDPSDLNKTGVRRAVESALVQGPRLLAERLPDVDGLSRLARDFETLLPAPARRRPSPALGLRQPVRLLTLLIPLLVAFGAMARAAVTPPRGSLLSWGGTFSLGWDHNVLQSSRAEEHGFSTRSPDYLFEIDRMNDWAGEAGVWGRLDLPSFYKTARIKAEFSRSQVAHSPILGINQYKISVRQKLPGSATAYAMFDYLPQVYLRHRPDKNALPEEPRFRPEAYRDLTIETGYIRPYRSLPVTILANYERRVETRWFRERDRRRLGLGGSVEWSPRTNLAISPTYEFGRTTSPRRWGVVTDFSSREHATGLRINLAPGLPGGPWAIGVAGQVKYRNYTTPNPAESSRYHRRDVSWWWNARLGRAVGMFTPFLGVEASGRRVRLPAGSSAATEDGEYDGSLLLLGIDWGS